MKEQIDDLSIIIVGASGHLAQTKILPALFALYCQGFLPEVFNIFGFARSKFTHEQFRGKITENLTCRYTPGESCADRMDEFLSRCYYVSGEYTSSDSFLDLYQVMRDKDTGKVMNLMFYLAIPPSVFLDVAEALGDAGFVRCLDTVPWTRVVVEKPFGKDRESSDRLTEDLAKVFTENLTYRIDHYLGKEVIQNLLVLRFANLVFEPIWNRNFIKSVNISWKEDIGIEGRGKYFDEYGIIRDVMQNHLLQMLALTAMEPPERFDAASIIKEKVRVLQCVPALNTGDVLLGQYTGITRDGRKIPGYLDEKSIPGDSIVPTFAAVELRIDNERWQGVPFLITAGKGLDTRITEIRIKFRDIHRNIFCGQEGCPDANELIIRVQPGESIYLRIVNKVPGMNMELESRDLDLHYKTAFDEIIPDAYERLLLDVIQGDKSLFIHDTELKAAWDIFTPVLREIEKRGIKPAPYKFGSRGPALPG